MRAPAAFGVTALSSANADRAATRLAPDGLQSAGAAALVGFLAFCAQVETLDDDWTVWKRSHPEIFGDVA